MLKGYHFATPMSAQGHKRTFAVNCDVRLTPESGHRPRGRACPLSAKSGHRCDYVATTLDRLVNRPTYRTDDAVCGQ